MMSTPRVTRHIDSPVGKELALRMQAYAFDYHQPSKKKQIDMVAHTCNPSTGKAETWGSLPSYSSLLGEYQVNKTKVDNPEERHPKLIPAFYIYACPYMDT